MRIAMIGCRGVPATFGGIERHVEEIGARLVQLGHHVIVYCRTNYAEERIPEHRGMQLRHVDTIDSKHLDAIVHTARCAWRARREDFDVVHYHAVGPGIVSPLTRWASKARVVQTIHGLDADRAKWGLVASAALKTGTWMSAHLPDATIVVSGALKQHYLDKYGASVELIVNGVTEKAHTGDSGIREALGVGDGQYVLFVGRLVPEKAPDLLIRAFGEVPGDHRLVIAGGSSFTDGYVRRLDELAGEDPRVLMAGYVFGAQLDDLYSNAAAFVLPSRLEGLPLTLLEAASFGCPVIASDIEPHKEVMGASGPGRRLVLEGSVESLSEAIQSVLADPDAERAGARSLRDEVLAGYSWDEAARSTEAVYMSVLESRGRRRAPRRS